MSPSTPDVQEMPTAFLALGVVLQPIIPVEFDFLYDKPIEHHLLAEHIQKAKILFTKAKATEETDRRFEPVAALSTKRL